MRNIFLTLAVGLLFVNCKDDDGPADNPPGNESNKQTYLGETHPVDFMQIYYFENDLIIQGGNAEESHGFGISFPDGEIGQINGNYILNTDDQTYNPDTEFRAGVVYYLGDSQYAQEGEAAIEIDEENEKIIIDIELNVQGETMTAHYEGNYN